MREVLKLYILPVNTPLHNVFCLNLNMYDHRLISEPSELCVFLILMCDEKIVQFVSTVLSFLHIMSRHNVDFCKNEPRFTPLINFFFILIVFYC